MSNEGANSVLALTVDGGTVVMTVKGNCSTATMILTAEDALMLAVNLRRLSFAAVENDISKVEDRAKPVYVDEQTLAPVAEEE